MLLLAACQEKEIDIPGLSGGIRRVVAEEVTGVRCPQCPDGTRTLSSLQQSFKAEGRELIVISIHAAGNFSVPFSNSNFDFRSPDAQALANTIGQLEGFPSSAINRRLLQNETSTFVNPHTRWEGVIREEFAKDFGLEVVIANEFDASSRQLDIDVDMSAFAESIVSAQKYLTVMITQDSIVDRQDDKGVINPNYIHRHILRDVVSSASGDLIAEPLTLGTVVRKSFSVSLPVGWDEHHCSVVAIVHHGSSPNKEILQAAEKHVIE